MQIDPYQLERARERWEKLRPERERNLLLMRSGGFLSVDEPARVEKFLARRGFAPDEARGLIAQDQTSEIGAAETAGMIEPDGLERVLGSNDLMGVAFLERGLQVARTVARIWVDVGAGSPRGYGSGFLVSPNLLMTNHHVLPNANVAARSRAEFDYQLTLRGGQASAQLFRLEPQRLFVNDLDLDYALVAVAPRSESGAQLTDYGWNLMIEEEGKAIEAQWVNIIQHPRGGYKQLAMRENRVLTIRDAFLTYSADTEPGSSGSPVFNDRWEVIGLHHSGVVARDAQGRILDIDNKPWTDAMGEDRIRWIANEGARTSRIVRHLNQQTLAGGAAGLLAGMLQAGAAPEQDARPLAPSRPQPLGGPAAPPPTWDGRTATWTIPLTVSVTLGGEPSIATVPAVAAAPAAPVALATAVVGDVDAAVSKAREALAGRTDVLKIESGFRFVDGWITQTPAVVVTLRGKPSPQAPPLEAIDGVAVEFVGPGLFDLLSMQAPVHATESYGLVADEITYSPPAGAALSEVHASMTVRASVSPDHGWPLLKSFLADTRRTLTVGMYDLGAPHITAALVALGAKSTFEKLKLAIQLAGRKPDADPTPESIGIDALKAGLGSRFALSRIRIGAAQGWVAKAYHIKVAVRDSEAFWLSSGNWQKSNQPDADPAGEASPSLSWFGKANRDWHVVVEHAGLAKTFERYLDHDFDQNKDFPEIAMEAAAPQLPDILVPDMALRPDASEDASQRRYFKPLVRTGKIKVRPLLTPDNFHVAAMDLVGRATRSLLIQNQTFDAPRAGQPQLTALLDRVLEKQKAGVDVRIIFRLIKREDARGNLTELQKLGFDMSKVRVQEGCHTKGVLVDGEHVMIGSQNWSQMGVTDNRDASLWFEDRQLAAYFTTLFEHDWNNLAKADIGGSTPPLELAWPGDPTPEGYVRMPWKAFAETF